MTAKDYKPVHGGYLGRVRDQMLSDMDFTDAEGGPRGSIWP